MKKNKGIASILIIGIIVLVVFGGVGYYLINRNGQNNKISKNSKYLVLINMSDDEAKQFFNATQIIYNATPKGIEFWVETDCSDIQKGNYQIPDGYSLSYCKVGEKGSHGGCLGCAVSDIRLDVKYRPINDTNYNYFSNNILKDGYRLPNDLVGLGNLAPWMIIYSPSYLEYKDCDGNSIIDNDYNAIVFSYFVPYSTDDAIATSEIDKLKGKIVEYMKSIGWQSASINKPFFDNAPNTYCFQKNNVIVSYNIGTGRCSMNSPCKAYDSMNIEIYIPKNTN